MKTRKAERDLSAWLDGELDEAQMKKVDAELVDSSELRNQRADFEIMADWLREEPTAVGQTAEAAWADIRRRRRLGDADSSQGGGEIFGSRLHWVVAMVLAMFCVLGLWAWLGNPPGVVVADASSNSTLVEWVDTGLENAFTMVYHDEEAKLTVIWIMEEDPEEEAKIDS